MDKAIINISGKEYELKFTIGFWKKIKEACGVTDANMEAKLKEDFGLIAPQIILTGITGTDKPTVEEVENGLDRSVMDVIEQAYINGMTKTEKELYEIAQKRRSAAIKGITDKMDATTVEDDGSKK